jgi:Spx/MgsR family transcriptional regulator
MAKARVKFLHKPNCTTCRKARALLEGCGCTLELRDLGKERLTAAELEKLIGDRDHRAFLNPRNELYRKHKMGKNPPSRAAAIRLMAREPNLIRRPVVISGRTIVVGFDQPALEALAD